MPPRKSDVAKSSATGDESTATPVKEKEPVAVREGVSIEELNLPKSIVTRLAKGVLPPNTQIQGNAMLAMGKSATVFVNYLATQANENAQHRNVKTIGPQDVMKALEDLEFPEFRPRLEAELAKFIETQSDKRNTYRKKVAADKAAGTQAEGEDVDTEMDREGDGERERDGDGEPKAKKARRDRVSGSGSGSKGGNPNDEADDTMGADHDEEGSGEGEDDQDEEEGEGEGEGEEDADEERFEVEEPESKEVEDEALDNGEDSD